MGRPWPDTEDEAQPYWLESDREKLYAWYLEKSERCPRCNIRYDDYEHDAMAWQPLTERCPGCEAVAVEWDMWSDEGSTKGLNIHLVRNDDPRFLEQKMKEKESFLAQKQQQAGS
jgi:hypothetical protein